MTIDLQSIAGIARVAAQFVLLALAAQALLEVFKVVFAFRSQLVAEGALRALRFAARAVAPTDADAIVNEARWFMIGIGLGGFRKGALRVDHLTPDQLRTVVRSIDPARIPAFQALPAAGARRQLNDISEAAAAHYALSLEGFPHRYARRLRAWTLLASAVVVISTNADAFNLVARGRFEALELEVMRSTATLSDQIADLELRRSLSDSLLASTTAGRRYSVPAGVLRRRTDSLALQQLILDDSIALLRARVGHAVARLPLLNRPWRPRYLRWWVGILASILLVSLGPRALFALYGKSE